MTSKSGHKASGFRKLQKTGFNRLFLRLFVTVSFNITKTVTYVTNYDHLWLCGHKEDGYKKLGSNSMLLMPNKWQFKQFTRTFLS
jgi:hypothetical protein